MALYLDEEMVGTDISEINFPGLILCAGATVQMSNGNLIGGHITDASTEKDVLAEIKRRVVASSGVPQFFYVVTNMLAHMKHGGMMPLAMAQELGLGDSVKKLFFNTGKLNPGKKGSFARISSPHNQERSKITVTDETNVAGYVTQMSSAVTVNTRRYHATRGWIVPPGAIKTATTGAVPGPRLDADFESI